MATFFFFPATPSRVAQQTPALPLSWAQLLSSPAGPTRPHSLSPLRGADGLVPHASFPVRARVAPAEPPGPPVRVVLLLPRRSPAQQKVPRSPAKPTPSFPARARTPRALRRPINAARGPPAPSNPSRHPPRRSAPPRPAPPRTGHATSPPSPSTAGAPPRAQEAPRAAVPYPGPQPHRNFSGAQP